MYEHLDRAVGAVLAELGDRDELVVITDRGMYGERRWDHLVDEVLLKLDLASPRRPILDRRTRRWWLVGLLGGASARRVYRYVGNRVFARAAS